uniref:Uncharacterized protein n=1 Tax=Meloidogyne enterolobii TaxID=390850 RepID=A0A6V7UQ04_MELEN|nr:unnamed protein product [Meloidogyne enterolobii]
MFYSLPTEIKLDIFKCLNYEDLCSDYCDRHKGLPHKLIRLETENFDFELNEGLEEKWKNGLENPISVYLPGQNSNNNTAIWLFKAYNAANRYFFLQLPIVIQTKNEIEIVYYYLNKLFKSSFKRSNFGRFIFNPELIQVLFGSSKHFYIQKSWLFMDYVIGIN